MGAQPMLQEAGGAGKDDVRGRGAEHDEVDLAAVHVRGLQRASGGFEGEVTRGLPLGGDVTLADAGTLADPVVGCFDEFLEVGVGKDPVRQV